MRERASIPLAGWVALGLAANLVMIAFFRRDPGAWPDAEAGAPLETFLVWLGLGVFNLALAGLVLSVRPRRTVHWLVALWFSANGLAVPAYQLSRHFPPEHVLSALFMWSHLVEAVTFIPLLLIPLVFPRRLLPPRWERGVWAGCVSLLLLRWWSLAPFVPGTGIDLTIGFLTTLAAYAGLAVGCFVFLHGYTSGATPTLRAQSLYLLGAYLVTAAAFAVLGSPLLGDAVDPFAGLQGPYPVMLLSAQHLLRVLVGTFLVAAVLFTLVAGRLSRARTTAESRPWGGDVFLAVLVVFGLLHEHLGLESALVWMLMRPTLFAYGILRFELLDVEIRERAPFLAPAILAGILVAHLELVRIVLGTGADASVAIGVATVGALAFGLAFTWPIVARLLAASAADAPGRGRDAYRAALEHNLLADGGTSADEMLRALRGRLGVSEREHAVMDLQIQAAHMGRSGELAEGARFLGKYRIVRPLGEGGFARTFLARDETLAREVVLKITRWQDPVEARRAQREGRFLAMLGHPRIVAIHDMEQVGGEMILVLEHVPGGSLADRLARGPVEAAEAYATIDDVLAGLEAAHREGLVHRDLKPANVLLDADGRAKLSDFGIASVHGSGTLSGFTHAGAALGTLRYMSPEQARGKEARPRSDVYAAGVLLYEMLSARPYLTLEGLAEFEARLAILQSDPLLPLPDVPEGVNATLAQALSKDPSARPASAEAMRQALRSARPPSIKVSRGA